MSTPVNFVDELINACVALVIDNDDQFLPALGVFDSTDLKVEYARQGNAAYMKGANGTCQIYPGEPEPNARAFPSSRGSTFNIVFSFDLIETKKVKAASGGMKSLIEQAMSGIFGDGGDLLYAQLADAGSNLLGGSFQTEFDMIENPGRGPSNVALEASLKVKCWHAVPLVNSI